MRLVLSQISGHTVLLWAGRQTPEEAAGDLDADLGLVSREMVNKVAELATHYVEVVVSEKARDAGTEGMVFNELDAPAAQAMLGPIAHDEIAQALVPVLS
jgi:ABC-type molybdenum transport system ATPase subunit/photorepair protein PhrA